MHYPCEQTSTKKKDKNLFLKGKASQYENKSTNTSLLAQKSNIESSPIAVRLRKKENDIEQKEDRDNKLTYRVFSSLSTKKRERPSENSLTINQSSLMERRVSPVINMKRSPVTQQESTKQKHIIRTKCNSEYNTGVFDIPLISSNKDYMKYLNK